jgi:hypothetical protein
MVSHFGLGVALKITVKITLTPNVTKDFDFGRELSKNDIKQTNSVALSPRANYTD